jgi:hypothetical protein
MRQRFITARGFIYGVIEEPISQATGLQFPSTFNFPWERGLLPGFSLDTFLELCGNANWQTQFNAIPSDAGEYLVSAVPEAAVVIGYEMPAWLPPLLQANGITYVDVRISPIRFSRDLYLVLRTNMPLANDRASEFHVSENEIKLEAGLLAASARQKELGRSTRNQLDQGILFIGQTRGDASLVSEQGIVHAVTDFKDEIRSLIGDRKLAYKPHPYDMRFARRERRVLAKMLGRRIPLVSENTYKLLASKVSFDVVTISSGTTQEARYFGRTGHTLFRHLCEPYFGDPPPLHIRFVDFCSPDFWGRLLGFDTSQLKPKQFSAVPSSLMRTFHDAWWGYSEFMIDNDQFWRQVVSRGFRGILARRLSRLSRIF